MKLMAAVVLTLALAAEASAWNARGHMVVATIAWDKLKPATRAKVSALVRLNPHYENWIAGVPAADKDITAFVKAATWADEIKGEAGYLNKAPDDAAPAKGYDDKVRHNDWHYKDLPFSPDGTATKPSPDSNAITQITAFATELGDASTSDAVRSYDLAWLLHLIGDVHQPLHSTARYTAALPDGDRGGNEIMVCPTTCESKPIPLHSFWDGLLGPGNDAAEAIKRARKLAVPKTQAASISAPSTWLEESLALAKSAAYREPIGLEAGPYVLTPAYKSGAGAVAEKRVALAGVRLAKVIEKALGAAP